MLEWTKGAGIDIDIWIQLLIGYPETPAFKKGANRSSSQTFAKGRENATGYKNKFCLHDCS